MNQTLTWMDRRIRLFVPALTAFLLLIAGLLPWGNVGGGGSGASHLSVPALVLMAVVYWTARAGAVFPLSLVFALGLLLDLAEQTPFGAQGLFFLFTALLLLRKRRLAEQPFLWLWGAYTAIVFAEAIYLWLMIALLRETALPFFSLLLRAIISAAIFPLVAKLFLHPAERLIPPHEIRDGAL